MLQIQTSRSSNLQDSSIIPLINVVFLILVFLIIAGQIANSEAFKVDLPDSVTENRPPEELPVLIVNMQRELFLNNQSTSLEQIPNNLISENQDSDVVRELLVKADAQLLVKDLNPILVKLKGSGVQKIALATLHSASSD